MSLFDRLFLNADRVVSTPEHQNSKRLTLNASPPPLLYLRNQVLLLPSRETDYVLSRLNCVVLGVQCFKPALLVSLMREGGDSRWGRAFALAYGTLLIMNSPILSLVAGPKGRSRGCYLDAIDSFPPFSRRCGLDQLPCLYAVMVRCSSLCHSFWCLTFPRLILLSNILATTTIWSACVLG